MKTEQCQYNTSPLPSLVKRNFLLHASLSFPFGARIDLVIKLKSLISTSRGEENAIVHIAAIVVIDFIIGYYYNDLFIG